MAWLEGQWERLLDFVMELLKPVVDLEPFFYPLYDEEDAPLPPAWKHYSMRMGFFLVFGLLTTQFLSAAIFVALSDHTLEYRKALWHCFVTATTVGYGDVALPTQNMRAWACVHVLFSVSWLAGLLQRIQAERTLRMRYIQRKALIKSQLDEKLIDRLDRDATGRIDMVEFVGVTAVPHTCTQPRALCPLAGLASARLLLRGTTAAGAAGDARLLWGGAMWRAAEF